MSLLRRVLPARATVGLLALGLAVAMLEAAGVALLVPLLGLVGVDLGGGTAGIAELTGRALSGVGIPHTLPAVLSVYVGLVLVQALFTRAEAVASVRVREVVAFRLRELLYGAMARMEWPAFVARATSHYVHTLTTQLDRVYTGFSQFLLLVSQSLIVAVYVALAWHLAPVLTLLALASGLLLAILSRGHVRKLRATGTDLSDITGRLHSAVVEHLANMKVAMSFGTGDRHVRHFETVSRDMAASWSASSVALAGGRFIFTVGSAIVLAGVVYVGVALLELGSAAILLLLYIFGRLVPRIGAVQQIAHQVVHAFPAFRSTVAELERCEAAAAEPAATVAPGLIIRDGIRMERVSFAYEARRAVLTDVSIEIPARRITAIIGGSGAGKTTTADLLLGLLRPSAGRVVVDGVPLEGELLRSWRAVVAYVPQETVLFNESIRENLLWALPDASDAGIANALNAAGAQFVHDLPLGLDTPVGERGSTLSGGERQRVALARALLKRPQLLVLDEPTSSLDELAELQVLRSLRDLADSLTIVIISHRPAALEIAHRVYVLEGGRARDHTDHGPSLRTGSG